MELPFRVPRVFAVCEDAGRVALVRGFERGWPLDLREGRQPVSACETVATVAAAVHRIGLEPTLFSRRYPTRRDHARFALQVLADVDAPEASEARAWAEEHLPPATPGTLLHGDLLGQNILLGLGEGLAGRPAVIDWEYAQLGDPAYDLAIVTRGVRRPFQLDAGLERLLEAYARAGGPEVTKAHVHVHELALAGGWHNVGRRARDRHAVQEAVQILRGVLRRATSAGPA